MVKGVGRMALDDYDEEFGYSLSEMAGSYSKKAYAVSDYELHSLDEIERCIIEGRYGEISKCLEHQKYLDDLQKRLTMILFVEEREGIMNWELREFLNRARKLAAELGTVAGRLSDVHMYKERAQEPWKGPSITHPAIATHPEPVMS